mmetsp:Transcript_21043/g.56648  ORF Transcript_21043/g.56648 Transcript_21043/m.56648 type:complete len:201 (+) Transcript_21043:508-1110(+)
MRCATATPGWLSEALSPHATHSPPLGANDTDRCSAGGRSELTSCSTSTCVGGSGCTKKGAVGCRPLHTPSMRESSMKPRSTAARLTPDFSAVAPTTRSRPPVGVSCSKNIQARGGTERMSAIGSYMLNCLTRSQIESAPVRSSPRPPRKVLQYHAFEQRGGKPLRSSPSALHRFHNSSMDVRCTPNNRRAMGEPLLTMSS